MKPDLLRRYPRTAAPFHRLVTNQRLLIPLLAMALLVLAACAQPGPLSPGTATSALGPADAAKTGQGWFLHLRGEAELTGHIGFQIIHRNITVDGFEVSRKNITVEVNPGDKLAMIGPRLVNKLRLWGIDVTCSAIKEDRFIIGISHADQPPQELLGNYFWDHFLMEKGCTWLTALYRGGWPNDYEDGCIGSGVPRPGR